VKLQDRPFEVLTILVKRPGEVISREEFRKRLWPADTFVDFDASLNTSINKVRQALSDDAENPRFIATVGRRGYRFIAPTTIVPEAAAGAVGEATPLPLRQAGDEAALRASSPRQARRAAAIAGIAAILLAAIILALRFMPQPTPKVLNVVQISHNEHLDPWGRITTDGARLFFLERAGGHWNVMQVPASGGDAQPFPEPSQNARFVDVSPDRSEFLSFVFVVRGEDLPLSITPVVGGPPRRVGDIIADDAVFSPDGRRIFFTKADGIYSCDRDGSHTKRLVALPARSASPRWSRDGRRLRFTLFDRTGNGSTIWEVSADGSNLHPVLAGLGFPGQECCGTWSADGRYFFFDSVREGARTVWAMREERTSWFAPAPKPVQLTFGPRGYGTEVTAGNNSQLFVWGGVERREVVRYERKTQRIEPLLPAIRSGLPAFSADGAWIAFSSDDGLWKVRMDGSQRQSLVSGLGPLDGTNWSPDGRRILFHTAEGREFGKFFTVSADGGTPAEISLGAGHIEAEWSSDGQSIVYARWTYEGGVPFTDSGIYLYDLRTSKSAKIPGSEGLIHPIYSPDNRFLMAVTSVHLNLAKHVVLKLFDTRRQGWQDVGQGTLLNPIVWSADSKFLYYQDILGPDEPVFRYAVEAKRPELFFDFANLLRAGYVRCALVRFAPNGDAIASLTRSDSDLYRLDLDLP